MRPCVIKLVFLLISCLQILPAKEAPAEGASTVETYWEVPALIIPVVKGDQIYAYVRILVQVMTKDATAIAPYQKYQPILQDHYFKDIYGALCDQWLPGKEPNQATIEKRLQRVTDNIVGAGKLVTYVVNFYLYRPQKKD
ncbi:hypothetical protein [Candidatus Odyssella thessalonicensis]|uniref:hypothetical protein n=1 Tax=Candidatus Odyssella thessalonicensis TaxID=84647 RepID=UPI000225B1A3|nr:hypothetical protein [Candidatus Odyssella thessalonicensis]